MFRARWPEVPRARDAAGGFTHEVTPTEDTLQRNRAAEALIRAWLADESGYDEATFPELKRALEQSRQAVGARSPFDAE